MQVFKLCLKIIKKNIPSLFIYVAVFLVISIIMTLSMVSDRQKETTFNVVKTNIAIIGEDDSPLIHGFKDELGKIVNFVGIPDEREALQDALYFRSVSYILRIPEGFTESFMKGETPLLEKTIIPNSISNVYVDLAIDTYFNTAGLYINGMDGITQESLVKQLKTDLDITTEVKLETYGNTSNHNYANYFFNYLAYSLLSVLILGMGTLMLIFNNREIKMRNDCSPISTSSFNKQFIGVILVFTLAAWLIMVAMCLAINYKNSFNTNTLYFLLNSFIFAFCGASISFLIGNLLTAPEAISAVSNVVTLGTSFISGVFVSQELLASNVLKLASFTPTYWYVRANDKIAKLTQFSYSNVETILSDMLIQFFFALAFFVIALVIKKKKRFN